MHAWSAAVFSESIGVLSKRITISTNTTDYTATKYFLRKYMQRESATALAVTPKQNVSKITSAFAQAVTDLSMHKTH